jgi:hypothetical protein
MAELAGDIFIAFAGDFTNYGTPQSTVGSPLY